MSEKLNEKYSEKFNSDQKDILKAYAFASTNRSTESINKLNKLLETLSQKTLSHIDSLEKSSDNQTILEKINRVKATIVAESSRDLDDQKIVRFLTLIDLSKEIKESV